VMNALWGQGLMSLAKVLVVVDKEVDVRNVQEAWWARSTTSTRARRALHDGAGGRARPREPRVHLRQQDGARRHAQAPEEGFTARGRR
jgi:4-hydroxy-3-polyprenylbenzoate decarboxylase